MAKLNFGLGGFAGQLSAEELANAYAMAGGRPEELQLGMPPAPPPAPVQSLPPPVAAPAGPVAAARGGPGQQIKQYDADLLGTANQRIDLAGQQGREESATFERRAGLRGEQATRARAELDDARGRVEEGRGREREKRDEADRLYEELRANAKPPGKKGVEQVMGIIGSVMAMGGGNRGMAQGASMLGSLLGSDREGWAAEQQSNSNLYRSALAGIDSERGGQSHDLDIASRIAALDAHYYDAALEQAKEMGLSEEAKRVATGLQLDMRDKATKLLRDNAVAQQKAQAGAGRSEREKYFWGLPFDQLRQMPAKMLGEDGQRVIKERTAIEGGLKKLDGEPGERPLQAGDKTPSGRVVTDPAVYAQLSAAERKAMVETDDAAKSLAANIDELIKLRKANPFEVGVWNTEAYNKAKAVNSKIQLAMKKADTLGTLDKGSVEFLSEMTGNPNSWTSAPEEKLSAIRESTLRDVETRAKRSGLSAPNAPAGSFQGGAGGGMASGQQPALGAGTSETVTMVRPDGKPFQVHPSQVARLRQAGWTDEAVASGAFIAQPADLMAQGGGQ
jgi:hypothetical protein